METCLPIGVLPKKSDICPSGVEVIHALVSSCDKPTHLLIASEKGAGSHKLVGQETAPTGKVENGDDELGKVMLIDANTHAVLAEIKEETGQEVDAQKIKFANCILETIVRTPDKQQWIKYVCRVYTYFRNEYKDIPWAKPVFSDEMGKGGQKHFELLSQELYEVWKIEDDLDFFRAVTKKYRPSFFELVTFYCQHVVPEQDERGGNNIVLKFMPPSDVMHQKIYINQGAYLLQSAADIKKLRKKVKKCLIACLQLLMTVRVDGENLERYDRVLRILKSSSNLKKLTP